MKYKPKRHLRHEIYSLGLVMLAPALVLLAFPFNAIEWKAQSNENTTPASCAFVSLSADETDEAIESARSSIKTANDSSRLWEIDFSLDIFDDAPHGGVSDISSRLKPAPASPAKCDILPLPRTLAAPSPVKIQSDTPIPAPKPAFSREELLDIDSFILPDFNKGNRNNDDTRRSP